MECDVYDFVRVLKRLDDRLPISDRYDSEYGQETGMWWKSQKEHMISWFGSQNTKGSGQYSRNMPNNNAKTTYNRLQCPGALLWIAEALGEDADIVQKAADAAGAEVVKRKRCGIMRKMIPWERISELLERAGRG